MSRTIKGRAHVYSRAHINTDEIIPARYLNTHDHAELAKHAMEDIDKEFLARVQPGDILVAGEDFGCGSSREHAVWALRGAGIAAVVGTSFARIFFRNSFNNGFLAVECVGAAAETTTGDEIEIDVDRGTFRNLTKGTSRDFVPLGEFVHELLDAGGLLPYIAKKNGTTYAPAGPQVDVKLTSLKG